MRAIANGSSLTQTAQQSLNAVVSGAQVVMENVENISKSSHQQASLIQTISNGIEQISMVVQSNSAAAEESAAASEELSSQAQILNRMVDKFQLHSSFNHQPIHQIEQSANDWDDFQFGNDKY